MTVKSKSNDVAKSPKSNEPKKSSSLKLEGKVAGIKFAGNPDDGISISAPSEDSFKELFNCEDWEQAAMLTVQCHRALSREEMSDKKPLENQSFLSASLIRDIRPEDAVERMLSVQMVATHAAMVRTAERLARTDQLNLLQTYEAGYNRLARTFTAQMEALRKHRHGGKQTVTVQHVNVEGGGQAIVGNVDRGGPK